jgi:ATP-dependent Clp protease ATP-binding subunit ClpA
VNSYNDGVLAKIARRPSVVEVADLDHAQIGVKGTLCDFFLRILQEGTLQTGSGMVVRTIPSLLFCFTSNVAYGTRKPNARFGFGAPTREEVREEVASRAREDLGHAFISRAGAPILFDGFSRDIARRIARAEIDALIRRITGATHVAQSDEVAATILSSLPALEHGARGILDETRARVAEALRHYPATGRQRVLVRCEGEKVLIEPMEDEPQQPEGVQK